MGRRSIGFAAVAGILAGCAHGPKKPPASPPATTQESCGQIRGFFKRHGEYSTIPENMQTGCRMRLSGAPYLMGRLNDLLEEAGWRRDPTYGKGAVMDRPDSASGWVSGAVNR